MENKRENNFEQESLKEKVLSKMVPGFSFKPSYEFYKLTGIRRKRFGQIWRGERDPLLSELQVLAAYFKINISELL